MSNWSQYLRLNELREIVNKKAEDNYFSSADEKNVLRLKLALNFYSQLEKELQSLDLEAWKAIKIKCRSLAMKRDEFRDYQFLFDQLNEVKGYIYLIEQGYNPVKFIPTEKNPTPDLIGYSDHGNAIIEVKTINPSLESILQLKKRLPKNNNDVPHSIPDELMSRIIDVLNHAKKQLFQYEDRNTERRIIFLCIRPEHHPTINPDFIELLIKQIQDTDVQGIEIVCRIIS